jgi:hypothetical protein
LTGAVGATGPQGPTGLTGAAGQQGIPGVNGIDGVSISNISTSGNNLIITLSNGQAQTINLPSSFGAGSNPNTLLYTINGF